jgi:outer membrane protein OmpA-like peptidoglycan-associated protein
VQIAQASGAAQYAPEVLSKAESQLQNEQTLRDRRADKSLVITAARNAEQTAEDARVLAAQRPKSTEIANDAQKTAERERQMRIAAEVQASQARQQAEQARTQAQQAQPEATADRMQLEAAESAQVTPQPPATPRIDSSTLPPPPGALALDDQAQRELRRELAGRLNQCLPSRDTPCGLVVTVAGGDFQGSALDPKAQRSVSQIAVLLAAHPGLSVEVEGNSNSNSSDAERLAFARTAG